MMNSDFLRFCASVDTPSIIYNKNLLEESVSRINQLKEIADNLFIYYAIKANSNKKICEVISEEIDGADVASISELNLAQNCKFKNISFSSPSIPFESLRNFDLSNVNICLNSLSQLEQGIKSGLIFDKVNIRLNHYFRSTINNQKIKSRFGMDVDNKYFYEIIEKHGLKISGIHLHLEEKTISSLKEIFEFIDIILRKDYFENVETINIGGGFLKILSDSENFKTVKIILQEFCNKYNFCKIIIEPGNSFVRSSAVLVSEVLSADNFSDGKYCFRNIVVDSSAYNLLSWTKVQLISSTTRSNEKKLHNIYGNTCYELDIFSEKVYTHKLSIGDRVLFFPVGAYIENNSRQLHMLDFPEVHYFGF